MTVLKLYRGVPGSGKTTQAMKDRHSSVYMDADAFHYTGGQYLYKQDNAADAHYQLQAGCKALLAQGINVDVTAIFPKYWILLPYFRIAASTSGVRVEIHDMGTDTYGSIHSVPDAIMERIVEGYDEDVHQAFRNDQILGEWSGLDVQFILH